MKEVDIEIDGFLTSVFRYFYRRRNPSPLEPEKPRFKWMPKYTVPVRLPDPILAAEKPSDELERRLSALGFTLSHWTREQVFFSRGKTWGDFSMKYIRLRLAFPFPLAAESEMRVEVADVCLFDTGDLWQLSHQLRDLLAGTAAQGR
jgi:hypothetical protein